MSRSLPVFLGFALAASTACGPTASKPFDPATIACEIPAPDTSATHPRAAEYQAILDELRAEGLPGAVLGIRDKDGTWFGASGYADFESKTPMKTCHRTRVMSVTKAFTAATVLKLVEEGKLSLDDTIGRWLPPEVARKIVHVDSITVRQLLSHTSGLIGPTSDVFDVVNGPYKPLNREQCLALLATIPSTQSPPGTVIRYADLNFNLLGLYVVPGASGTSMDAAMQQAVLRPLNLSATSFAESMTEPWTGTVPSYAAFMSDGVYIRTDEFMRGAAANCRGAAASGLISNAYDLMTFIDALYRQRTLLSPASVSAVRANYGSPGYSYGLGNDNWQMPQGLAVGHAGGQDLAYRTFAYHLPARDVTVVLWFNTLTNRTESSERTTNQWVGTIERVLDVVFADGNL